MNRDQGHPPPLPGPDSRPPGCAEPLPETDTRPPESADRRSHRLRPLRRGGGLLPTLAKVAWSMRVSVATRTAYLGATLLRVGFIVLILFIISQLWRTVGRGHDVRGLTGFTIAQMIWYLAFTEAMEISRPPISSLKVDEEVRTGDIAYRLARPLAYPLQHLGDQIGDRAFRFAINLVLGCGIAWIVAGPVRLSLPALGLALVLTGLAVLADWIITFAISLCSFWVERTDGIHLLYLTLRRLMGGLLFPLTVFPDEVQHVLRYSPFPYLVYAPARTFAQGTLAGGLESLAGVLAVIASGLTLLLGLYRLGSRRVSAQGG